MNKSVKKVKDWAESKAGESRFVSGDTNVTYEDILEVCGMAELNDAKNTTKSKAVKDVDKANDNS